MPLNKSSNLSVSLELFLIFTITFFACVKMSSAQTGNARPKMLVNGKKIDSSPAGTPAKKTAAEMVERNNSEKPDSGIYEQKVQPENRSPIPVDKPQNPTPKVEDEDEKLTKEDTEELRELVVNRRAKFFVNQKATYLANRKEIEQEDKTVKTLALNDKNNSVVEKNIPRTSGAGINELVALSQGENIGYSTTKIIKTVKTYQPIFQPTVPMAVQTTSGRGIPNEWANWIVHYGKRTNVDPLLILEVMRQESTFKPFIKSPVGAAGLMQFMPATAQRFGINPLDPEQAIRGGASYLAFLLNRYGGNVFSALAAYNAGEGAVDCFLTGRSIRLKNGKVINSGNRRTQHGVPPYKETQNYVQTISSKYFRALQMMRR